MPLKNDGDVAVKRFEKQFDHVALQHLLVTEAEMAEAETCVSEEFACSADFGTQ